MGIDNFSFQKSSFKVLVQYSHNFQRNSYKNPFFCYQVLWVLCSLILQEYLKKIIKINQSIQVRMNIKILVVLICILAVTMTAEIPKKTKSEIVDANRFYSQENKEKTYKITELEKDKPIIVVLKSTETDGYNNPVTLTLTSGSKSKECKFRSYEDICALEVSGQVEGSLNIKCQRLPCNVEWKIYQSQPSTLESSEKVASLYKMPTESNRMIVNIYCPSVIEKQTQDDSRIALAFSNVPFQSVMSQSNLFLVFDETKQGYLQFWVNPKYKTCAKIKVTKGTKTLSTQLAEDFLKKNIKNSYSLADLPNNKNFAFEIAFHAVQGSLEKSVTIRVTGQEKGERKTIRSNIISFNPSYSNFDLSYGVPKINTDEWKQIRLELQTQNPFLLVQILFKKTEVLEVQATQFSYFNLKKGEKLDYHLIQQKKAEEKDQVNITLSKPEALTVSKTSCNVQKGCEFSVEAKEDIQGHIYLGSGTGEAKQIIILDFGNDLSFTRKIKELESVYIKKKLEVKKAVQVTINSPNVIVYMASTKKCKFPTEECFDQLGNMNRHFFYYPDSEQQAEVIFWISALDSGTFTLTLLPEDTQFVELKDSQPFVYMFDSKQDKLKLRFKRQSKVDVNFNLIAPLHALDLVVQNGRKLPEDEDAKISAEGFLQFKAEDTHRDQFIIEVRKREAYAKKFVHFTLIASTKGKHIRLESGITHYQTLTKSDSNNAQYIFQFEPSKNFILNFYCHNTKQKQINIKLAARALGNKFNDKDSEDKSKKHVEHMVIDKPSDVLDLSQISKTLCETVDDDDSCEIAVELQNQMDIEIDIAITLMSQHTILEIKDGIWQSFPLNSVATSAHFYFHPRNMDRDIGLMFKTTDPGIRLKYRLFYASRTQIDMSQWPFPSQLVAQDIKEELIKHKPVNHYGIGKESLKACWPNCVLLISIIDLEHKNNQGSYSIMASNSIMEIPEKTKIDITLQEGQTKSYLVDLKYALDIQQNIYFYVSHSIGLTSIFANVYSEKNDRIPDQDQFDFNLNTEQELKIPISAIKEIMTAQNMDQHLNIYLYLVVESLSDAKVSIQFTFKQLDGPNEKIMEIDTFQHVILAPNEEKIYYTPIYQPFQVKIVREKGFPIFIGTTCKEQLEDCLQKMRKSDDKGQQLLTKVAAYTSPVCQNCFYVFKLKTEKDPGQITIHLQSQASEIELVENKGVYDFTEKGQTNNYIFYAIRGEEVFVNIHVTEGEIETEITDFNDVTQTKTGKKILNFIVPAQTTKNKNLQPAKLTKQQKQEEEKQAQSLKSINDVKVRNPALSLALMTAFGLSDKFIQFHVSIKSANPEKPSIYTITYASGERQFELQDGLLTDYSLEPEKETIFYYSSAEPNHIYLTMSMEKSTFLKDLKITIKSCEPKNHIIDDDCWVDQKTDTPSVKEKTPHPTIMYLLPNKKHLAIVLNYGGSHTQKISLGINHQEIMILPFDVEFPFILHNNETIDFLVELSNAGYIQIITRKCDESNPIFSYTFDYDSFQKGEFTYEAELGANPKSRFMSKVKPGTLYMQVKTPPEEKSLLSIYVKYSEKKIFDPEILPGNKGNLDYSITDSSNAELTFKPPTCPDSSCPKFKYYLMTANNMRDLYTQLVCPSNFFSNVEFLQGAPIKLNEVSAKENPNGTLSISFQIADQISYVGIKASNGKDKEVFYKPIQIVTFWGQLSRTSHSHKLFIGSVFICSMVAIIIFVRRNARKGYKPFTNQEPEGF